MQAEATAMGSKRWNTKFLTTAMMILSGNQPVLRGKFDSLEPSIAVPMQLQGEIDGLEYSTILSHPILFNIVPSPLCTSLDDQQPKMGNKVINWFQMSWQLGVPNKLKLSESLVVGQAI